MDRIDKKLEKFGFKKVKEDYYGVSYERIDYDYEYTHEVNIYHKANGRHLIISSVKGCDDKGFSSTVGLPIQEVKLLLKKFKIMKRKYNW